MIRRPSAHFRDTIPLFGHHDNGLTLDNLLAAKALIEKVGSVKAAEEALAALKRLG